MKSLELMDSDVEFVSGLAACPGRVGSPWSGCMAFCRGRQVTWSDSVDTRIKLSASFLAPVEMVLDRNVPSRRLLCWFLSYLGQAQRATAP